MNKGIMYGIGAYVLWGFFPIFWKFLHHVSAFQVIGHRITWSFIVLMIYVLATLKWQDFRVSAFNARTIGIYTFAGILLSVNWLVYVWGVNAGFIVETSLGYFINPLLSVLMGVIFLRERLRPFQWIPVIIAAIGVGYLTFAYGQLPWIALSLAFSFGFYGLVKKLAPLGSLYGLTLETASVLPIALIYLIIVEANGSASFLHEGYKTDLLLASTGIVTTIPLLMFASAARQIPLNVVGILQYIAPTLQFLIGVFLYKEPFDHDHLIGFSIVWMALIIFWLESFLSQKKPLKPIPVQMEDEIHQIE